MQIIPAIAPRTEAQLGTEAYGQMLRREHEVLTTDIRALRELARARAASSGNPYQFELGKVMRSEVGQAVSRDVERYNQRSTQHNEALRRARQAAANKRAAAKTQAAACASCFTVHNGECY